MYLGTISSKTNNNHNNNYETNHDNNIANRDLSLAKYVVKSKHKVSLTLNDTIFRQVNGPSI